MTTLKRKKSFLVANILWVIGAPFSMHRIYLGQPFNVELLVGFISALIMWQYPTNISIFLCSLPAVFALLTWGTDWHMVNDYWVDLANDNEENNLVRNHKLYERIKKEAKGELPNTDP